MLTAGDEFGRTQQGNNNAYAQDNAIGWVDWAGRDRALEDWVPASPPGARRGRLVHPLPGGRRVVIARWQADGCGAVGSPETEGFRYARTIRPGLSH
jgi:glycogen operon protein